MYPKFVIGNNFYQHHYKCYLLEKILNIKKAFSVTCTPIKSAFFEKVAFSKFLSFIKVFILLYLVSKCYNTFSNVLSAGAVHNSTHLCSANCAPHFVNYNPDCYSLLLSESFSFYVTSEAIPLNFISLFF